MRSSMRQDDSESDDVCDRWRDNPKVGDRRAIGSLAIGNRVSVRQSDYMLENICSRHPQGTYHLTVPGQAHVGVRTLNCLVARCRGNSCIASHGSPNRRRTMTTDIKRVKICL